MKNTNQKCHNCKFGGKQFKVSKLTHLHCMNEEIYPLEDFKNGETAWETLREFGDTCDKHKYKQTPSKGE